jgi:hypothetical protein
LCNQNSTRAKNCGSKARLGVVALLVCLSLPATGLKADETSPEPGNSSGWKIHEWKLQTSIYTKHWDPDPAHVNHQKLLGLEAVCENDWLFGAAFFDNSFGQSSQFVYFGKSWRLFDSRFWYVKLMGGLLHGYEEPYEDKIPLNGLGIAPAILPSLGFRYKRVFVETNIAGTAAMTITAGIAF